MDRLVVRGAETRTKIILLIADCGAPEAPFSSRRPGRAGWKYVQIYASVAHVTLDASVPIGLLVVLCVDTGSNADIRGVRRLQYGLDHGFLM